jgi:NAD(P)-dependent dehydrogenase (short-subunit alcohol dehydrogenase family)
VNKVVLITGVVGGIGSATARVFAEAGWHVIGVDMQEAQGLSGVQDFILADVSKGSDWQRMIKKISAGGMVVSGLVNNAAVMLCKPLMETTQEEWEHVMASNLSSVYLATRHVVPLMRSQGGAIINVSSVHGVATSANVAAYAASKGGVLALTRALAIELAPERIRVNAVLPGAIDTPMLRMGLDREKSVAKEQLKKLAERHLQKRIGRPEEIAQTILFLADEQRSSFVTGQAWIVDGGATSRLSTE